QVRRVQGLERRELVVSELVDALRRGEILEAVLAEIAEAVRRNEVVGRLREQHLAAVTGRGDASGSMDVDPDVALVRRGRLAGVETHPDLHRPRRERRLRLGCGGQ